MATRPEIMAVLLGKHGARAQNFALLSLEIFQDAHSSFPMVLEILFSGFPPPSWHLDIMTSEG
jgi:hypothetical protein